MFPAFLGAIRSATVEVTPAYRRVINDDVQFWAFHRPVMNCQLLSPLHPLKAVVPTSVPSEGGSADRVPNVRRNRCRPTCYCCTHARRAKGGLEWCNFRDPCFIYLAANSTRTCELRCFWLFCVFVLSYFMPSGGWSFEARLFIYLFIFICVVLLLVHQHTKHPHFCLPGSLWRGVVHRMFRVETNVIWGIILMLPRSRLPLRPLLGS